MRAFQVAAVVIAILGFEFFLYQRYMMKCNSSRNSQVTTTHVLMQELTPLKKGEQVKFLLEPVLTIPPRASSTACTNQLAPSCPSCPANPNCPSCPASAATTPQCTTASNNQLVIASEGMGAIWGYTLVVPILREALAGYDFIVTSAGNYTPGCPNLIVRSHFVDMEVLRRCATTPYIIWNAEWYNVAYRVDGNLAPLAEINILAKPDRGKDPPLNIWVPYAAAFVNSTRKRDFQGVATERKNFLAYMQSNCVARRQEMFKTLCSLRPEDSTCHGLGQCSRSSGVPAVPRDLAPLHYSRYAFVLCMESRNVEGYVTEKLALALLSGAIPIYAGGGGRAKTLFNPKAYIDVDEFASDREAAEYIAALYKNKAAMQKIMDEPMFLPEYTAANVYKEDGVTLTPLYESYADSLRKELYKHEVIEDPSKDYTRRRIRTY